MAKANSKTERTPCCRLAYRTGYQAGRRQGRRTATAWVIKNLNRCLDDVSEIVDPDTRALILGLISEHETHFKN